LIEGGKVYLLPRAQISSLSRNPAERSNDHQSHVTERYCSHFSGIFSDNVAWEKGFDVVVVFSDNVEVACLLSLLPFYRKILMGGHLT
jgi:hypothetical protein